MHLNMRLKGLFEWGEKWGEELGIGGERENGGFQEFSPWAHHLGWNGFLPNLETKVGEGVGLMGNYPSSALPLFNVVAFFPLPFSCLLRLFVLFWFFYFLFFFNILVLVCYKKKKKNLSTRSIKVNLYNLHFLSSHFSSQIKQ